MRLEQANVVNSIDNLMTFPRLRILIERGQVMVHGAYFGVATGQLSVRDPATENSRRSPATIMRGCSRSPASDRLPRDQTAYAARRLAWISLRLIRHSAIWTALSAAPLRRLSDTIQICNPFSIVASSRMRLM